jgi:adenylylsulfate reductase, subunit A
MEKGREQPEVSEKEYRDLEKEIYQPLENYRVGRNEITAGTVSPSYLLPIHGLQRLEKIMDEYAGGIGTNYMTNGTLLERGLELLTMMKEDMAHMGAEDLHQLQRVWELHHRLLASESVTQHTLFREETRWPGYYYRGDHMKLDDANWHCSGARTVPAVIPNPAPTLQRPFALTAVPPCHPAAACIRPRQRASVRTVSL